MKKVLIAQKICREAREIIEKAAEPVFITEGDTSEFKRVLKTGDIAAVILGTWINFTKDMMDIAPGLKVISRTGAGVDNVDIVSATKKGILVLYTPEANILSVAEHTLTLIAAISKQILFLDKELRKGNFMARRLYLPVEISGKIIGIIGYGKIGRIVAQKCMDAFNIKVIVYDPYLKESTCKVKIAKNIKEVFKCSDYISIHVPLLDNTKNMVNAGLLSLMKETAYIINTSRGGIIDEEALIERLKNKKLAGAALDVFKDEPVKSNYELLELSNVILTPHSAALTREATTRVAIEAAKGVVDYLKGRKPRFIFNN